MKRYMHVVLESLKHVIYCLKKLKETVGKIKLAPMYEERRWGTLKTVDRSDNSITRRVKMFNGMNSSLHYHNKRDEIWVFLSGSGEMILDNERFSVCAGDTVKIPRGVNHMIKADEELEFLEVHIGKSERTDINRLSFDWKQTVKKSVEKRWGL